MPEELQRLGAVRRKRNNLGAARDQALRLAQTEFIAFVDCDVVFADQLASDTRVVYWFRL